MASKNLSISEVEKILKKQKIVFAFWNCSSTKDDPYQMWYLPLKELFGKTIIFDPRKERFIHGSKKMNELFFNLIKKEKPDYVFTNVRRDEQTIETMEKIKEISPKTKIIAFSGDDDKDFEPLKRYQALFVDCTFIAQPNCIEKYHTDGINNSFYSFSINTNLFKPMNLEKIYDVTFIGKPLKPRLKTLRFLIKNGINLKIFGRGWNNYPEFKDNYLGALETEEMTKMINQSKINLSLLKNEYGQLHFKGRVLMFPSCKSFSLTEYFDGCLKFFKNNKEIMMFKDDNDLLKKINYYLKHEKEREEIAENSYKKVMKSHNVLEDFKSLFKKIMENLEMFSTKLPKIKEKIITLKKEDFEKSNKEIEESLSRFDYVSFSDGNSIPLKYKNYLQAYSLNKTGKEISCCDYYIHDKVLGDYFTTNVYKAFRNLKKEEFNKAISLNQIAVTKDYFIKKINKFREFFNGKIIDIINKENACLVSIPLVRINKLKRVSSDILASSFFHKNFALDSYLLFKQKKLFTSKYFYRLLMIIIKNPSIAAAFIKFRKDKKNWKNATSL